MDKIAYIILAIYLALSATGLVLIKSGSSNLAFGVENNIINLSISLKMLLGAVFYVMSFLLFIVIIPKFNLSYIYPLATGIMYLIILIVSILFLGEKITVIQAIGSLFILVGVIALNFR